MLRLSHPLGLAMCELGPLGVQFRMTSSTPHTHIQHTYIFLNNLVSFRPALQTATGAGGELSNFVAFAPLGLTSCICCVEVPAVV
jgi:hypothetical protein